MNPHELRQDFAILQREMSGKPLVYFDNAATTQKPRQVLQAIIDYYETTNANVHRAIHDLGEEATARYEASRTRVAEFIGARAEELVFVRNASEALNLVAYGWARPRLRAGDEILTTPMEHHSNLVPWQQVAAATGATLRFIPLTETGELDMRQLETVLHEKTRLVTLTQASNVLGTLPDIKEIARRARAVGAKVLVDGAQSVPHMPVDVRDLGVDWLAFSGHKMLGPMGIGALWGQVQALDETEPFLFGGEMISQVWLDRAEWAALPHKFEAGTPNVAGAIGLAAAVEYLQALGMQNVQAHEQRLVAYALARLREIDGVIAYGPPPPRSGLVAFNLGDIHPHDVSTVLNSEGIAIRAGHHCAQPLADLLGVAATNRASFYIYNTEAEIDRLVAALEYTKEFFGT